MAIDHPKIEQSNSPKYRESSIPSDTQEKARRRVHILLCFVFWLTVFEGAARKWGPSSLSTALYFIKDPFVIMAYVIGAKHHLFVKHWLSTFCAMIAFILLVLGFVQILVFSQSPFVIALGVRSYVLYAFLAFLWPLTISREQLIKLWRLIVLVCLPMAILVFAQYHAAPSAKINTLVKGEVSEFVTGGHARPTGTFTFVLGQSVFDIFLVAVVLGEVYRRRYQATISKIWTWIATASVVLAVSFSVSRTAAVGAGIIIAGALFVSFFIGGQERPSVGRALGPAIVIVMVGAIVLVLLPEGVGTLMERHESAVSSEGSEGSRAFSMIIGAGDHALDLDAFGIGIGRGSPVAHAFVTNDADTYISEYEIPRVLQEAGIFVGSVYILFRFSLAIYLLGLTFQVVRESGDIAPFLLALFCAMQLISGDVESNPSVGGLTWCGVALTLAAAKVAMLQHSERKTSLSGLYARFGNS